MVHSAEPNGVLQGSGDMDLPGDLFKESRTPLTSDGLVCHGLRILVDPAPEAARNRVKKPSWAGETAGPTEHPGITATVAPFRAWRSSPLPAVRGPTVTPTHVGLDAEASISGLEEMAESQGFEPRVGCPTLDFESSAFDHSASSPYEVRRSRSIPQDHFPQPAQCRQ